MAQIKVGTEVLDKLYLASKAAGEDLVFDVQRFKESATQAANVLPNRTDQLLGSIGAVTDYLDTLLCVPNASANSRVVLKEGNPIPRKQINTHASTASTTTVLNTVINTESVAADQYRDNLVRVGTGPYRKILTHPSFAAGVVNSYTLDQALSAAPGTGVAIYIENPDLVAEVMAVGSALAPTPVPIKRHCTGEGWRVSTDTGVSVIASGDFDNV